MTLTVRPLRAEDYPQWRPLWDGYTHFYECYLDESVTVATWDRALADSSPLFCRVVEKDGNVIGFAMCVLHEGTGKALIDALIDEGKREGWSKLYWVTRMNNPARKLYDHYGEADDYVRYRISL